MIVKKKLLYLLMILMSFTLLFGCGENDSSSDKDSKDRKEKDKSDDEDEDENDDEVDEDSDSEDDDVTDTYDDDSDTPDVVSNDVNPIMFSSYLINNTYYSDEEDMIIAESYATRLRCLNDEYPELQESIENYSLENEYNVTDNFQQLVDMAVDTNAEEYWSSGVCLYENWYTDIFRADDRVVSIITNYTDYLGGAHGTYYTYTANFDTATGEMLHIYDVISEDEFDSLFDTLEDELLDKYGDDIFFSDIDLSDTIESSYDYAEDLYFVLGYEGITFYFQIYELSPYASGSQQITLRYDDYPDLVKSKYMPANDTDYILNSWLLNGHLPDGETEYYTYSSLKAGTEDNPVYILTIAFDDEIYEDEFSGEVVSTYFVVNDGNYYLLAEVYDKTNGRLIREYSLSDDTAEFITDFLGDFGSYVPTNPDSFRIYDRCDYLSTYEIYKTYTMDEDGIITTNDDYYTIEVPDGMYLETKDDLEVNVKDTLDGKETLETIDEGTILYFYGTDNHSWVDFIMDDGRYVRLYVDDEYTLEDDTNVYDVFDGVNYASN